MDQDVEQQMQSFIEFSFSECLENEVIYGMFALDIEITKEIKEKDV